MKTLSLRPFRFLQDLEDYGAKKEVIIVKALPATEKSVITHHVFYGRISRSSGKSGSQVMLTHALDVTGHLDPFELIRHYDPDHPKDDPLSGAYVEELVSLLRNMNDVRYPVQERLWVNLGYDCLSFLIEESAG